MTCEKTLLGCAHYTENRQ